MLVSGPVRGPGLFELAPQQMDVPQTAAGIADGTEATHGEDLVAVVDLYQRAFQFPPRDEYLHSMQQAGAREPADTVAPAPAREALAPLPGPRPIAGVAAARYQPTVHDAAEQRRNPAGKHQCPRLVLQRRATLYVAGALHKPPPPASTARWPPAPGPNTATPHPRIRDRRARELRRRPPFRKRRWLPTTIPPGTGSWPLQGIRNASPTMRARGPPERR